MPEDGAAATDGDGGWRQEGQMAGGGNSHGRAVACDGHVMAVSRYRPARRYRYSGM